MISINKSQCSFIEFFQLSGCALAAEIPCFCAVIEVRYNMNMTLKQYSTQLANLGKNCGFVLEERRKAFFVVVFPWLPVTQRA